ncbi:unnamed protein product [Nesidiocoris tenuis]|uniref:Uncharacterized protein n=1 Tax=Nesidiocoris tenuis TaxID=355587 RepID=A0A6H5GS00_9HEMI|nr:unnamed protein product [Nesidiocoris tenuis]
MSRLPDGKMQSISRSLIEKENSNFFLKNEPSRRFQSTDTSATLGALRIISQSVERHRQITCRLQPTCFLKWPFTHALTCFKGSSAVRSTRYQLISIIRKSSSSREELASPNRWVATNSVVGATSLSENYGYHFQPIPNWHDGRRTILERRPFQSELPDYGGSTRRQKTETRPSSTYPCRIHLPRRIRRRLSRTGDSRLTKRLTNKKGLKKPVPRGGQSDLFSLPEIYYASLAIKFMSPADGLHAGRRSSFSPANFNDFSIAARPHA